jgi:hypothetical protein
MILLELKLLLATDSHRSGIERVGSSILPCRTLQEERLRSVFDVRNGQPGREHQLLSYRRIAPSCLDAFQQCLVLRPCLRVVVRVDHLIGEGGHAAANRKAECP